MTSRFAVNHVQNTNLDLVVDVAVVNTGRERVLLNPSVWAQANQLLVLVLRLSPATTPVACAKAAATAAALAAAVVAAAVVVGRAGIRVRTGVVVIVATAVARPMSVVVTFGSTARITRSTARITGTTTLRTTMGTMTLATATSRSPTATLVRTTIARRLNYLLDLATAAKGLIRLERICTARRHACFFCQRRDFPFF